MQNIFIIQIIQSYFPLNEAAKTFITSWMKPMNICCQKESVNELAWQFHYDFFKSIDYNKLTQRQFKLWVVIICSGAMRSKSCFILQSSLSWYLERTTPTSQMTCFVTKSATILQPISLSLNQLHFSDAYHCATIY